MRVAVDATMIKSEQAGLKSLALGLTRALAADERDQVTVVTLAGDRNDWGRAAVHRSALRSHNPQRRALWRETHLDRELRRIGAEVVLTPAPEPALRSSVPQVVVVNDLGPLMAPALYGWTRYARYAATLRGTCRRASRIICISGATKLDLVRWAGVDPARVDVVHCAPQPVLDADFHRGAPLERAPIESYVLCVGAALAHKNLGTLIEAFRRPLPGMPRRLVLVGPEYAGEVRRTMRAAADLPHVEHLGFVDPPTLRRLYTGASALAFPSLFEGFGIPVAEALASGIPVVASGIPSLREAGGPYARYVDDPTDPLAWREALATVGDAQPEADRGSPDSRAWVAQFSWEASARRARRTLELAAGSAS